VSPLKALHCPGNEFKWVDIAGCEACEDRCLPIEIVRWIWKAQFVDDQDHYHADPSVLSVTETMRGSCLRKAWYERKRDYAETPQALMARTSGTAIHKSLEQANTDGCSEVALKSYISVYADGWVLRGTADRLTDEYVGDYKCVDAVRKTYDERHAEQLNIYNQMAGGGREMRLWQVARKKVATHVVHEIEDALDVCLDRCRELIAALEADDVTMLPPEGKFINFFRAKMCDFCAHKAECWAMDDD